MRQYNNNYNNVEGLRMRFCAIPSGCAERDAAICRIFLHVSAFREWQAA